MAGRSCIVPVLIVLGFAFAWADLIGHELADAHKSHHHQQHHNHYPRYKYGYGVKDANTWDKKTAAEWRDGHTVKGHYSLQEPNGSWRTVVYIADDKGFRAQVHRTHG